MKKLMVVTIAAAFMTPALAEEVNRTLDADPDGHVHVSNIAGSVTVRGWSRDTVEVTGTLGRNVDELRTERDGDEIVIKVKVPRRGGRGIDSDLTISIPSGSSLDVGTVSADIDVSDVAGEQSLHSVSGNIESQFSGEDVSAESVSGDVEIRGDNSVGDVEVSSVSGDVVLFRVSGEVDAESVSGSVTVNEGRFSDADLSTVNGKVIFRGMLQKGARLDIETVNGYVDAEVGKNVSAEVDIETLNGRIRNCFGPEPKKVSKYGPGWELSFTEGRGEGRIRIETVNGGVSLCN
ncbi:MAG: DUF4097 family beta strand repeat-containing protein [Pseudomonadota bacterium]